MSPLFAILIGWCVVIPAAVVAVAALAARPRRDGRRAAPVVVDLAVVARGGTRLRLVHSAAPGPIEAPDTSQDGAERRRARRPGRRAAG